MFSDYASSIYVDGRLPRPDRRPQPRAAEIRLRVRRLTNRTGA